MDVYYSSLAISDLTQIRDQIAENNVTAAAELLDAVDEVCNRFGQQPHIGRSRDDLLPGIRVFPVKKNYAVFYRVHDDAVEIVRVVHAARDFNRLFEI
ncbi:MAG: type II toxin-antitoxin system RelE/ParE family toxin [Planctomycetaceae bacterium]|nr:type II toxin-antitoxin system RelE/ParE family toxin [Planctomycetaceae bacterium]